MIGRLQIMKFVQNSPFYILKLSNKLLIDPPKLTMAHLSPSVDRDRRGDAPVQTLATPLHPPLSDRSFYRTN